MTNNVNAKTLFRATMPFIWIKLAMSMSYVVILTAAAGLAARNIFQIVESARALHGGAAQGIAGAGQIVGMASYAINLAMNLNFWAAPLTLTLVVAPIFRFLLKTVGRYYIRVGHIAVLTRIATAGKIPRNQVKWGMAAVKKSFGRATAFFFLNKMVCRAVAELQNVTRNMLGGLGAVAFVVNSFKGKLLNHIDECCLAYTFYRKDTGPFQGAVKGIAVYAKGWRGMAKATLHVMGAHILVSGLFYAGALAIIAWGTLQMSLPMATFGIFVLLFFGAAKRCLLDTYSMIAMLLAFLREAQRQGDVSFAQMGNVAMMSRAYTSLLFQANHEEHFMTGEQERELQTANPTARDN